jgi:hypothetical protein
MRRDPRGRGAADQRQDTTREQARKARQGQGTGASGRPQKRR